MPRSLQRTLFDRFVDLHVASYRLTGGRIGGRVRGVAILLLDHVGRRSGKRRTNPLLYIEDGDDLVIVASKGGSHKHPAWWLNLRDSPRTTVQVGGERRDVVAHQADAEERARLWPRLVEVWPDYETYQRRTSREIPVIILSPTGHAGA
ncbi:MAG TPA: nitroreductase family deazaflavin-dependent oxidoreductase [Solirubrobacterales bacterium]|nr:nitroreductase family deazaflavin-dependent oxidoreductase [Solirubrobacterales bacterium]